MDRNDFQPGDLDRPSADRPAPATDGCADAARSLASNPAMPRLAIAIQSRRE